MAMEKLKVMYDRIYAKNPRTFGFGSLDFLKKVHEVYPIMGSCALDVGCGEGLASKWLAEKSFSVDAIDLSEYAFIALQNVKNVVTYRGDILEFEFTKAYDLINLALVAHHFTPTQFESVIERCKAHTKIGGLNALRLFTTNSDFAKQGSLPRFYDDGKNVDTLYSGWNQVYESVVHGKGAATAGTNEVREVMFKKLGK